MPGVKKLSVAVIGQSDTVEEYLSPKAAAALSRRTGCDRLFAEFAAAVAKEAEEQEQEPDFEELKVAVIGAEQSTTLAPRSAAELAERLQKERLFLQFAEKVAAQARRLQTILGQREQLQFVWDHPHPHPSHDASGRGKTPPLIEAAAPPSDSEGSRTTTPPPDSGGLRGVSDAA